MTNVSTLESIVLVTRFRIRKKVPPQLTLELNILIFVLREKDVAFQTALRHPNAC